MKLLRIFIDRFVFRFYSDSVLSRFLVDRILFRVFNDRVFFESPVKGSSSGSAVLLGHQCSFSAMSLFFFNQIVLLFFSHILFYIIFSKRSSHLTVSLTCFNNKNELRNTYMTETQNVILKIYAINFPIYTCHQIPDEYIVQKQPPEVFFNKNCS